MGKIKKLSKSQIQTKVEFSDLFQTLQELSTPVFRKDDKEKPQVDLLPALSLLKVAEVMTHGAQKYGPFNWRGCTSWRRYLAAALRHLLSFMDGEDKDHESNLSHLAHSCCCLLFLLEFETTKPECDDRYKRV